MIIKLSEWSSRKRGIGETGGATISAVLVPVDVEGTGVVGCAVVDGVGFAVVVVAAGPLDCAEAWTRKKASTAGCRTSTA